MILDYDGKPLISSLEILIEVPCKKISVIFYVISNTFLKLGYSIIIFSNDIIFSA